MAAPLAAPSRMPEELRKALKERYAPQALIYCAMLVRNPNAKDSDRLEAAKVLMERAWGKIPTSFDGSTGGELGQILVRFLREGETLPSPVDVTPNG